MDIFEDVRKMHTKFDVIKHVSSMDNERLKHYIKFRINFIDEELTELKTAYDTLLMCDDNKQLKDTYRSEFVDALVDLIVVYWNIRCVKHKPIQSLE